MSTMEIDWDKVDKAHQGLGIYFIVTIFVANCALIYRIIRKGAFLHHPKCLTIISLAFGDIFLALFALVVHTEMYFHIDGNLVLSCSTQKAFSVYIVFLIHFVYATGLIVLAIELSVRFRTSQTAEKTTVNIHKSVLCSSVPWVLGLIIVLPLVLSRPYELRDSCLVDMSTKKSRIALGVCVILPALLAVLACCVVMSRRLWSSYIRTGTITLQVCDENQLQSQANVYDVPQPYTEDQRQESQTLPGNPVSDSSHILTSQASDRSCINPEDQGASLPSSQYPVQECPPQKYQEQHNSIQQYPEQQYAVGQYPEQQYPVHLQILPQYAPPQQYTAMSSNNTTLPGQTQNLTGPILAIINRERKILCLISVIHFLCAAPTAVFTLGTSVDGYTEDSTAVILDHFFFWLSVLRSLITPIIFAWSVK